MMSESTLHTGMSSEQIRSLAYRGGALPLNASISPRVGVEDWVRRVDLILSLSMLFNQLAIEDVDCDAGLLIRSRRPALQMPNLEDLSISSRCFPCFVHFYSSWSFENLKRLRITDFIPMPVFGKNLSYCHFRFTHRSIVEHLLHFIGSISLEKLTIELVGISQEDDGDDVIVGYKGLDISSITSYSFHSIGQTSHTFAGRVLLTILPPNVTEMSLSIVYPSCPEDEAEGNAFEQRKYLLSPLQKFSKLKILDLHFSGPDSGYTVPFSFILKHAPSGLETVRLEAPGHDLTFYWIHSRSPKRASPSGCTAREVRNHWVSARRGTRTSSCFPDHGGCLCVLSRTIWIQTSLKLDGNKHAWLRIVSFINFLKSSSQRSR
ncbi:hypothetical protein DFH11DRAFT_194269 [Phellopilus nigrolimitatus]|nr:hypothetical protein DFH11DRAFT_194269 [Phellopilus nigrolimitatus]